MEETFDKIREIIIGEKPGSNILRYITAYLKNDVIRDQLADRSNNRLSYLYLKNEAIPFDEMPYASSLCGHNLLKSRLNKCLEIYDCEHQYVSAMVNKEAYDSNTLYVTVDDNQLDYYWYEVEKFNRNLYKSTKQQLRKIEIFANHGVFQEEKNLGQKFILTLELSLDIKEAATTCDLTKSVHYGELCHKIIEVFQEESLDLIESAVNKVANFILDNYSMVKGVKVLLKKPWAPIGRHLDYAAVEINRERHFAYIAMGSNMGNKEENLKNAMKKIEEVNGIKISKVSSFIVTEPWGNENQEEFLNGAIKVETYLTPRELMSELLRIEHELGRVREIKWGPRIIDLDIVLYDDIVSNDEFVILPHPLMHLRDFVLKPLNEIAPYALHPLKNKRVFELLD